MFVSQLVSETIQRKLSYFQVIGRRINTGDTWVRHRFDPYLMMLVSKWVSKIIKGLIVLYAHYIKWVKCLKVGSFYAHYIKCWIFCLTAKCKVKHKIKAILLGFYILFEFSNDRRHFLGDWTFHYTEGRIQLLNAKQITLYKFSSADICLHIYWNIITYIVNCKRIR